MRRDWLCIACHSCPTLHYEPLPTILNYCELLSFQPYPEERYLSILDFPIQLFVELRCTVILLYLLDCCIVAFLCSQVVLAVLCCVIYFVFVS